MKVESDYDTAMSTPAPTVTPNALDKETLLRVLQEILNKMSGSSAIISTETRIDKYFKEVCGADSLEYLELTMELENVLGIRLTNDDWAYVSGSNLCKSVEEWEIKYAPLTTFGRLADLLAHRAKLGIPRPITVLGATSLAAGAFKEIERIGRDVNGNVKPFAPSTPIVERFRGHQLAQFWARVRTLSANRIPALRERSTSMIATKLMETWGAPIAVAVFGIGFYHALPLVGAPNSGDILSWLLLVMIAIPPLMGIPAGMILVLSFVIRLLGVTLGSDQSLLPREIRTFRDVALLISGDRGGWCGHCGYDLTGLTEDRCPECGMNMHDQIMPKRRMKTS